jgi:autotransporter passenger strand-loop-strand repeat protein
VATGTTINGGVLNLDYGGAATGTTINNGGVENVLAPGPAISVTFGNQNGVINTNTVLGSLNHTFSTLSLQATPGGTLDLAESSVRSGSTISNWHVGDVVDFLSTKVTGIQENAAHTLLTVTYGTNETASYSLGWRSESG